MRVLMVSDVYFPRINGVSTAIQTYRRTLLSQGIEVQLIAPDYGSHCDEAWITRVPARKVPRDPEDRLVRWGAMHDAVEAAVDEGVDLIHVQTPFVAQYASTRAAKRCGVPVVATYHTLFEEYLKHYAPMIPAAWLRALARGVSRRQCDEVDAVIVPSRAICERLGEYGVSRPLHILPTGVSLPQPESNAREQFRARFGIAAARPVALFVGRVAHEKNIGFLIDVVERTRHSVPDILLVIAGEGPALTPLRKAVSERGLSDCVRFIGYLERGRELPACYASADAFVFASRTETQGLVLLEAMAVGVPVVALAEMGTKDILDSRRGALTPADDPVVFSQALVRLLGDNALRARLAAEGRAYAREWSDDALAGRLAGLYREIVTGYARANSADFKFLPL